MGQSKWGLICALSCCWVAGRLDAQEASDEQRAPRSAEERIELQLKQPLQTPLEFVETPLNNLMQVIAEEYDIPVQFDNAALEAVAQSPETEVTVSVGDVSLRSALDLIFRGTEDLTYIVDNEVLLITTEDEANMRLEVRVYRVDDLLVPDPGIGILAGDADYDSLVDLIVANVERQSWSENGTGQGEIRPFAPGMLVVSQTRRVHEQIDSLLAEIRSTKEAVLADTSDQADKLVTRGIAIDAETARTPAAQNTIREMLMKSADWQSSSQDLEEDVLLSVLPNRVLVRHKASVVRKVSAAIRQMSLAADGNGAVGAGRGSAGGGDFEANSDGDSSPSVNNNRRGARRGGF
jgi:hypothetical protein